MYSLNLITRFPKHIQFLIKNFSTQFLQSKSLSKLTNDSFCREDLYFVTHKISCQLAQLLKHAFSLHQVSFFCIFNFSNTFQLVFQNFKNHHFPIKLFIPYIMSFYSFLEIHIVNFPISHLFSEKSVPYFQDFFESLKIFVFLNRIKTIID